jgi:hypothetical protein
MWPKYDKPFFFYVRDRFMKSTSTNGVTVCFVPSEEGFAPGIAVCSTRDNFCKKTGRDVAFGRAEKSFSTNTFVKAANYDELSNKATELAMKAVNVKSQNYGKHKDERISIL